MSKPRVDPTFGISSVDVLILTERHPACRRREAQPGSCKERENLAGDAKGKGPSGANRKAESTDAPERGGLLRSSDEAAVVAGTGIILLAQEQKFQLLTRRLRQRNYRLILPHSTRRAEPGGTLGGARGAIGLHRRSPAPSRRRRPDQLR